MSKQLNVSYGFFVRLANSSLSSQYMFLCAFILEVRDFKELSMRSLRALCGQPVLSGFAFRHDLELVLFQVAIGQGSQLWWNSHAKAFIGWLSLLTEQVAFGGLLV